MAPTPSNLVVVQQRSESSSVLLQPCSLGSNTDSTQFCCPIEATCVPNSKLCAFPFLPTQSQSSGQLESNQLPCIVKLADKTNSSSASTSSDTTEGYRTVIPSPSPTSNSYPVDFSDDDQSPTKPLLFTYPLLILAFIAVVMGGAFIYYRYRNARRPQEEEEEDPPNNTNNDDCPHNDSTVDLELPAYEEHAWNSRWASTGRNRRRGESGEIVEVVQLRGERGVLVPVAVVRESMFVEPGDEINDAEHQESRKKKWFTKAKERFGRVSNREQNEEIQRQNSEWSVDPPAYVEGVKAPEPAVTT